MEYISLAMLIVTVVFATIVGIGALVGLSFGWKRALVALCRSLCAILISFIMIKILYLAFPTLLTDVILPLFEGIPEMESIIQLIYDSEAVQSFGGTIIFTVIIPFVFVPIFVINDLFLRIPAHFVGKALGIPTKAQKKALKRQKKQEKKDLKLRLKEEKKALKLQNKNEENAKVETVEEKPQVNETENVESVESPVENVEASDANVALAADTAEEKVDEVIKEDAPAAPAEEAPVEEAKKKKFTDTIGYAFIDRLGGFALKGLKAMIILMIFLFPLTALMYTMTEGAESVISTAAEVDARIPAKSDQVILNHDIVKEGYYDCDEIEVLINDTLSPVCDNFFLKMSYSVPMRALHTGLSGSSDSEGMFRIEISQVFDLASDAVYLLVDLESYGEDQKNAINGILGYISKSQLHTEVAADLLSYLGKTLSSDPQKLDELIPLPEDYSEEIKTVINPVLDIFANTTAESVKNDINTINDMIVALIDYNLPKEIAVAITSESYDNVIRALANEEFLYRIISDIYKNEDFHDMIAPVINFTFFLVSREFDPDIQLVNIASDLEGLTDENLHYEATVLSAILLDAVEVIDTIPDIMGSGETAGAIENANMASLGRLLDDAMDSLFIGENIKDLFVLILDSETFDNMRGIANVVKNHIDDEDLSMENLLTAVQQFIGILDSYESADGQNVTELADTLRKLSSAFDPSTSAIIKEIVNDSSVLNMGMISGGSDETTASTQKLLSVFVDQLASGNISDEEFEKEAKAVDYAMQLINASSSSDSSVKDIYSDEEGMQEMIATMAESKIASESIKAIAYDEEGNLTPDALELSEGLDEDDRATLKSECEKYYKGKAAEGNADFETIDKNLKAIAAVLGEDITDDINTWKAELGLNDQQNENENGN